MRKWTFHDWRGLGVVLVAGAWLAQGCVQPVKTPKMAKPVEEEPEVVPEEEAVEAAACRSAGDLPDPDLPDIDCPAPPNTFDVTTFFAAGASPDQRAQAGPTWDAWAWASFAAMNWPASKDPNSPTGFVRGVPDLEADFANAANDAVLVWETFKEKRELFHPQPPSFKGGTPLAPGANWQDVTFDPSQVPNDLGGEIEACPGVDPEDIDDGHHRFLAQGIKHPASVDGAQALDETVEVASPPLENPSDLCAGYTASTSPTLEFCQENLFPANEDDRAPVGPRIWRGNPGDDTEQPPARPIFFEVKLNYDFWAYILDKNFQDDTVAKSAIDSGTIEDHPKLPFRTSAASGPGRSTSATFAYDANSVAGSYAALPDPETLPGIGSVQLKAAWLLLTPEEIEKKEYHTTEAVYYQSKDDDPEQLCYRVDTFGLLGLHIIQRVHSQPFNRTNSTDYARGGTFIFATWEHTSLGDFEQPTDYYYANYLAFPGPLAPLGNYPFDIETTPFPNYLATKSAIPVVRQQQYPLMSTRAVNDKVRAALPSDSIWQKYRLIGTQFAAVGSEAESMALNQPHLLANLVVETNAGLQDFEGLPPGVTPTKYYTDKVNLTTTQFAFDRTAPNVVFNRVLNNPINMGGCMGCHGVAQLKGYNFSFVFAGGGQGAGVDTQHSFEVAGTKTSDDPSTQ